MFFLISEKVNLDLKGFAVDDKGLLYLGVSSKIQVLEDGVPIRSFRQKRLKDIPLPFNRITQSSYVQ